MPEPAVIFDFGNVLAFFDYTIACDRLGPSIGLSGGALRARLDGLGFRDTVVAYESGRISDEAFSAETCRLAGLELPHSAFATAWADIFRLNEPVARLAAELKALGYPLALGSNTNPIQARHFQRQFADALSVFDRRIFSFEVGHMKPAAPFYRACAEALGRPPGSCLFIDDLPENVEGARSSGMQAYLYCDPVTLRADLRDRGIAIRGRSLGDHAATAL